ncbi:Clp protease N-terminal domain-containing protein [Streptomyces sp. T12]|uniref:Clp protease N-terminal domain-containing protein n=2 Tax=unclassified Streptomyces TaxID=2593676 RepID=UPI0023668005|nr:Clp protease N-terminal domain-containing protein [Streptomyces sp. T12]WDF36559.1 Clp protease N-terminal domain-containing protein [Streptomyces sp. T12]
MQPRIPRQSAQEQDCRRPDAAADDARLSDELAAVISGARRRAVRDGDRQIDTAHLLHSLLERDPDVYAVFGDGPQIARLLGYLVQRSIGYGLRWQGTVEDSGAVPVVLDGEGFSPLAASAMEHACRRAARRGDPQARGVDLLAAIVTDPQARAVEVLARAGIDANAVRARIDERRDEYAADGETTR